MASAAVLIALVAATLAWWMPGFVLLVGVLLAIAVLELNRAAGRAGAKPAWPVLVVAVPGTIIAAYAAGTWAAPGRPSAGLVAEPVAVGVMVATVGLLAALGVRLRGGTHGYLRDTGASALILAYLAIVGLSVVIIVLSAHPVAYLVSYVVCIAANDSGAYWAGSLAGRHKMVPGISPAKTWEGFAGGLVLAAVAGVLVGRFLLHVGVAWGVAFGLVLACGATVGDLVESAMKRDAGQKDMGHLLPGHGGALDRLDSMLYCAPLAVVLYSLMGLIGTVVRWG
ncbi:MAG: phosphatidate cytidylyltransferase [Actinomycetia bacterium]|nr:phosphatidate cytidylyltransferase [Actinomycetes bacterium]